LTDWILSHRKRFHETLFVSSSRNLGATGGRNLIFERATGSRLLILDNDVVLPEGSLWLEMLWTRMDAEPRAAIVCPLLVFTDYPDIVQAAGIGLTKNGRVGYLHRAESVEKIPQNVVEVAASLAACWLLRRDAQQAAGFLSEEFYPAQYEDVDFCLRLGQAGWKILCDRGIRLTHTENVTTRNLRDYPFARLTVKNAMIFKEKWKETIPAIATLTEEDIYWGPVPRAED